jgi:predicted RNA binding protein YcfA (HicA-like mRNA interferase family)
MFLRNVGSHKIYMAQNPRRRHSFALKMERYVSPKRRFTQDIHGTTSQKTAFIHPEDGGDTFLRNVGSHKIYTASHPRRRYSFTPKVEAIRSSETSVSTRSTWRHIPEDGIHLPRRWRRYVPPKRRFAQDLHCVTSQKTAFFIVTAVKTSNLIY